MPLSGLGPKTLDTAELNSSCTRAVCLMKFYLGLRCRQKINLYFYCVLKGEWEELSEMDHEEAVPVFNNEAELEDSESESSDLEEDEEDEDEKGVENGAGEELSSDDDQD